MTEEAVVIAPGGAMSVVAPKDRQSFTLHELQALVGGPIERVLPRRGVRGVMWVNEEGRLMGLAPNPDATSYAMPGYPTLLGTAVIVRPCRGRPVGYWRDNNRWHAIYTMASRKRHVMDGHGVYEVCHACNQPAATCREHRRPRP